MLHQLEQAGHLRQLDRVVNGRVRKYYALTAHGGQALGEARAKITELVGEILTAGPARHDSKVRRTP